RDLFPGEGGFGRPRGRWPRELRALRLPLLAAGPGFRGALARRSSGGERPAPSGASEASGPAGGLQGPALDPVPRLRGARRAGGAARGRGGEREIQGSVVVGLVVGFVVGGLEPDAGRLTDGVGEDGGRRPREGNALDR